MEVRDPVYGRIELEANEGHVVAHPWIQRLRDIRQTGFSIFPFPGATHSRYSHSLGAMCLAGRAFDNATRGWQYSSPRVRQAYRNVVRLAAMCHDLGHAPFSHCTEFAMPGVESLGLHSVQGPRRATHEDYTIAILVNTDLADLIAREYSFTAEHVAALVDHRREVPDDFFYDNGLNHRRLLSQLISSELDVDRLDYLVRDAIHTGTAYGRVDVDWLIGSLSHHVADGQLTLAIHERAIYAFDHFLLGRHHMFLQVYFHHKSVVLEEHLRRYMEDEGRSWSLPSDLSQYLCVDDASLWTHLRGTSHPMAQRIVQRRPYERVVERHGSERAADLKSSADTLSAEGIDAIYSSSTGRLSRYVGTFNAAYQPPIYVLEGLDKHPVERVRTLTEVSGVFGRYADARCIGRIYVAPEDVRAARQVLGLPVA